MCSLVAFILAIISLFSTITATTVLESTSDPSFARKISFWAQFEKTLNDTTPPKHFIGPLNENQPVWLHKAEEAARTPRPINVDISYYAIGKLNTTHHQIVGNVSQLAPKIPFVANTSGVVMIAKKEDLEVTLIAIKMLRRTNTTVPIELFLNTTKEDYNDICNKVLPVLNVKCLYFSDFLSKPMMYHFGMTHQTFKALSILLSSFENVLFLESDNIAVSSLDTLFISSPFTEYGLVIWPDLWTETVSDIFFNITGRRAPEFLTHASTDSGQLMISKTKHGETLILASYYSLFGKNQYYILFNQNAWGDGDKEAYHNAAEVLKKPYYRVNTFVEQLNFYKGKDQEMLAMMQFHPVDDYRKYVLGNDSIKVSRLFIHTDYCRVNITQLMYRGTEAVSEEGEPRRIWASKINMIELFGYDVEKAVWECAIESADIFHSGITDILYHNLRSKVNRYYRIVFEESGEKFDTYGLLTKLVMIIASLGILVLVVNKFIIKKSKDAVLATKGQ